MVSKPLRALRTCLRLLVLLAVAPIQRPFSFGDRAACTCPIPRQRPTSITTEEKPRRTVRATFVGMTIPEAEQHLSLALQAAVAGFGNMVRTDGTGRTRAAWTK